MRSHITVDEFLTILHTCSDRWPVQVNVNQIFHHDVANKRILKRQLVNLIVSFALAFTMWFPNWWNTPYINNLSTISHAESQVTRARSEFLSINNLPPWNVDQFWVLWLRVWRLHLKFFLMLRKHEAKTFWMEAEEQLCFVTNMSLSKEFIPPLSMWKR